MKIKHLLLVTLLCQATLLTSCSRAHAGWFGWSDDEVNQLREEHHQELVAAEQQTSVQRKAVETWELVACSLAIGAVLLLIIGTALGTRTRHAAARTTS